MDRESFWWRVIFFIGVTGTIVSSAYEAEKSEKPVERCFYVENHKKVEIKCEGVE